MSGLVQPGNCSFNDAGTLSITESVLEPIPFAVNKQECVDTFLPHWYSAKMKKGVNNDDMQPFNSYIIEQIGKNVSTDVEAMIWKSKYYATGTTYLKKFDGFLATLKAGAANDVSGVTLSGTNIIAQLKRAYAAIPTAVIDKVKIYLNRKMIGFYLESQAERETLLESGAVAKYQYLGIELYETPGLPDNIIIIAEPANLIVGTDLGSDLNEVKVIDRRETEGDRNFRYVLRFTLDTTVVYPAEVVFYGENLWT
jgi:hypothetical protein